MQIFRLRSNVIFMVHKALFSMSNMIKQITQAYLKEKQSEKKFQIFGQNHGLITLAKCEFFDFALMLFL